jgi:hypothetical protein
MTGAAGLHVVGNRLENAAGQPIVLRGVNRLGTEYTCIHGYGIFDGPSDLASVQAIRSWGATLVRIPINEDCWLGINGVPASEGGATYRNAIVAYVNELQQVGVIPEISLMWAAPGTYRATYQSDAPDEDHSPAVWASMAQTFKYNPNVILGRDLRAEQRALRRCRVQAGCAGDPRERLHGRDRGPRRRLGERSLAVADPRAG